MTARISELPYFEDSAALFMPWAERRWAVFLDSGFPHCSQGRFDIIAAEPTTTLITRGAVTEIRDGANLSWSSEDPFSLVRQYLGEPLGGVAGLPFIGGAIGYFGYDLARRIERLPEARPVGETAPEMIIGVYDWAVVVDHQQRRSWLVGQDKHPALDIRWPHLVKSFSQIQTIGWQFADFTVHGEVASNLDRNRYVQAFRRIQRYIREGDCYQVNLTREFLAYCSGSPWSAYQDLRTANPAPFSGYLNFPEIQVLSSSPERFLQVIDGRVETKPIKGTRPRDADPAEDLAQAQQLRASTKDRAENVMIVDLLRNDLGKSCRPGSVHVPKLFEVESYATVHHLVSTVCGELADGRDAIDLMRGCFPGGSITGAPKIRAMEIIDELEPHRRSVYCGAIGYLSADGQMDTNIAIRTLVHSGNTIRFWAGGGIVADSDAEAEFEETYHKAAALLRLLDRLRFREAGIVGYLGR